MRDRKLDDGRARWAALLPDRWAWARLIATPTTYLLLVALVVTMAAKLGVVRQLHGVGFVPAQWLLACSIDVLVLLGLAALLSVGEHVSRWMMVATVPLATVIAIVAVINAGYLSISGDQLTWQIFSVGLDRFDDVQGIVGGTLFVSPIKAAAAITVLVGIPIGATTVLRRARQERPVVGGGASRARAAGLLALVALFITLLAPRPQSHALGKLSTSGIARMYAGLVGGSGKYVGGGEMFAGYSPIELVDATTIERLRSGPRPNILLLVIESARHDATSLGSQLRAATPNLSALALRGIQVTSTRAVFPHTTKSVWSMLCGRLPLMQSTIYENTPLANVQCLPRILDDAGWRTAFFQSAAGTFEDRPRLVDRLGYDEFLSAEHITREMLGYLAADDRLLSAPVLTWIDAASEPFFATVLTSATHHPYLLTAASEVRARTANRPIESDEDRYHRLLEEADAMLGELVTGLEQRGVLDQTIVIVVGDHGEGFGAKGIKQHDSNYYEEGLHVPWVMAGPAITHGEIATPASLADVAPTLLGLLGTTPTPAALRSTPARDIRTAAPDRVLPFGCFFDMNCRGFVQGSRKVVFVPETGQAFAFDLAKDPDEENPTAVPDDLAKTLESVQELVDSHRTSQDTPRQKPELTRYPRWRCDAHKPCRPIAPMR